MGGDTRDGGQHDTTDRGGQEKTHTGECPVTGSTVHARRWPDVVVEAGGRRGEGGSDRGHDDELCGRRGRWGGRAHRGEFGHVLWRRMTLFFSLHSVCVSCSAVTCFETLF